MNRDVLVCSKCKRTIMNEASHTRGWLIASHKNPERHFNGEMVIRCPDHITDHALRNAENGKDDIK